MQNTTLAEAFDFLENQPKYFSLSESSVTPGNNQLGYFLIS